MDALSLLVTWSLRHRIVVLLATAVLMLFGANYASGLAIDAVPELTNVQVQINTTSPALSPVEVEQYITVPVERALAGIPHSTEVRSVSKYGLSVVTIVFSDDTDIYFARSQVNERMRDVQSAVPAHYGKPEMGPISSALGEVYQFVVRNDALTLMQREEILDWQIAPQLRTVPGVIEVNSFGGEDRQYQVVLDPKRLQAAGVSVAQVIEALEKSNRNAGGGYIQHNREQFVIGADGMVKSLDDLKKVVIGATAEGVPITVSTVGDVQFGPRLRRGAATRDGEGEIVLGVAMMLLGENARTVTAAVKERLASIAPSLPPGTTIEPFYDRSVLVSRTLHTVAKNLGEGALLVVLVLFLLLGDLRAGVVVAAVIPLAMLFALVLMRALGLSGNLMSLGAIDFGLIVDGSVIIVENTVRRLSERRAAVGRPLSTEERASVVGEATLEVRRASVFGEAIVAIVYLPVLALIGTEGKLFRPMATTVLFTLFGAFLLSLTVVPVLASYLIRPSEHGHETWLVRKSAVLYRKALGAVLERRVRTLGASVVALACAVALFTHLGAEFVPQLDEGDLLIEARRLPGVALSESVATALRLERALLGVPEVERVVSRTGAPEVATDPMGIEQSDVYISLKDPSRWRTGMTKATLRDDIARAAEENVPEISSALSQPIQMRTNELLAGIRSDVALTLYGPNLATLQSLGDQAAKALQSVPGAVDVRVEQVAGLKYLRIIPDRARLARYGLTVEDINQITETMAVGYDAGDVLEGERRFGIRVKSRHDYTGDLGALRALPLRALTGQVVPLGDVAELVLQDGPAQVSRSSQSRRLTVEFNVRGADLLTVVQGAQRAVAKSVSFPTGYRPEWGGQFEHYARAKARLGIVVPTAFALILWMLWLAFRSMRAGLLIFINIPFAAVGGVVALWLRDIPFSISAGVGFVALFGVAVLNGLVLVSFARELEAKGEDHMQAIRLAAEQRLRPVLMTALVAIIGFVPMALSTAPGSEVQRPLATVVIGGLLTATLLTLFVLPVVYGYWGKSLSSAHSSTKGAHHVE